MNGRVRAAIEFRHESWFDDEVFNYFRANACALCVADADDLPSTNFVSTATWGYVRLWREEYADDHLADWVKKLKSQGWDEAYAFFKHEDTLLANSERSEYRIQTHQLSTSSGIRPNAILLSISWR